MSAGDEARRDLDRLTAPAAQVIALAAIADQLEALVNVIAAAFSPDAVEAEPEPEVSNTLAALLEAFGQDPKPASWEEDVYAIARLAGMDDEAAAAMPETFNSDPDRIVPLYAAAVEASLRLDSPVAAELLRRARADLLDRGFWPIDDEEPTR